LPKSRPQHSATFHRGKIYYISVFSRIADLHSFHPDPDPYPIRIQGYNDQKLEKKITAEKKIKFFF
jgi:hypothetical protein